MTYYETPEKKPLKLREIRTRIRGMPLVFYTAPGVFSKKRVDFGTRLLAETMPVEVGKRVLDLGCGYGVLSVVAAKLGGDVYAVDSNKLAVYLTKFNARANGVSVLAKWGNLYEPFNPLSFHLIVSNPPFAAGLKVIRSMVEGAPDHLEKNGVLLMVARRRKGGERVRKFMEEVFGEAEIWVRKGGYYVYAGRKA